MGCAFLGLILGIAREQVNTARVEMAQCWMVRHKAQCSMVLPSAAGLSISRTSEFMLRRRDVNLPFFALIPLGGAHTTDDY
jgi:hypothetical protein